MLKKIAFLAAILALVWSGTASAVPPPAYGGYQAGWGMNPNKWDQTSGSWSSGFALYDPLGPLGGSSWINDWTDPNNLVYMTYDPITLELWIEMYMIQTYSATSYQWHRLGNEAEHICFTIEGTVASNNGQYISLVAGTDPMTHLYFRENIFGTGSGANDIPITWEYRWGTGLVVGSNVVEDWTVYTPDPDVTLLIADPCDHWYEFRGCFDLVYHHPDGYYTLTLAGCPVPAL